MGTERIYGKLNALGVSEIDPVATTWLQLAGQGNDYALHERAHRDALVAPRPNDAEFQRFWSTIQDTLDVVLERFEARYLSAFRRLDDLLAQQSPSKQDVERLRQDVPNNFMAMRYFFEKLDNPAWLRPLREQNFFKQRPTSEIGEEGVVLQPNWAAVSYLVRMATIAPDEVLAAAQELAASNNGGVHLDLIDVALAMPPAVAAQLIPAMVKWLELAHRPLLPLRYGELVSNLANSGEVDAAFQLASTLLAVLPDLPSNEASEEYYSLQPRTRLEDWEYGEFLRRYFPALLSESGLAAFALLCHLLNDEVRFSRGPGERGRPYDYSCMWRPAIEDHPQNMGIFGVRDLLISAIRDSAGHLIESGDAKVDAIVQILEQGPAADQPPWQVFRRLTLHLLRRFPAGASHLVAAQLTDREQFEDTNLHHEYTRLLQEQFGRLLPEQQTVILDWIKLGPDLAPYKTFVSARLSREPINAEIKRFADQWRRDHLAPISPDLPPEWARQYRQLVAALGEAEHPEFLSYTGEVRMGLASPVTASLLESQSIEWIAGFLRDWHPQEAIWIVADGTGRRISEPTGASMEGLAQVLANLVAATPQRFAAEADRFQGMEPTYIRAIFDGLRTAMRDAERLTEMRDAGRFPWSAVLALAKWAVRQGSAAAGDDVVHDGRDLNWEGAQRAVADLITAGLQQEPNEVPAQLGDSLWPVIQGLLDSPNPRPEEEHRLLGGNMTPAELSINSVRGAGLHAAMHYAVWVRRHLQSGAGSQEHEVQQLALAPEVVETLNRHVDPARDPSLAIHAVFGQWLPTLVSLDPQWTSERLPLIFPRDDALRHYRDAAWEAYLMRELSGPVFAFLQDEYRRAVDSTGIPSGDQHLLSSDQRLGVHLMLLYCWGKIQIDAHDGLLSRFWEKASGDVRQKALEYLGFRLTGEQPTLSEDVRMRLQILWEYCVSSAREIGVHAVRHPELAAFGWWFASARFEAVWSLEQLIAVLQLTDQIEPLHLVVERLAGLAPDHPAAAVTCLYDILRHPKNHWRVTGWDSHVRTIIRAGLQSDDATTVRSAQELINRLAAYGFPAFSNLLGA